MKKNTPDHYKKSFFTPFPNLTYKERIEKVLHDYGIEYLLESLALMLKIRQFENRAEVAYQHGYIGGFFHSDVGQESIVSTPVLACGSHNWFFQSYRCHGLALALGVSPKQIACELYGKANGIAKGRGGSMHLCSDTMPGGFGIVGGQIPLATGAAFSIKYRKEQDRIALCFMGDGATAQGVFHESMNLASLHSLPLLVIVENNGWGMGTHSKDALAFEHIAEKLAPSYSVKGYTIDGMNFIDCLLNFKYFYDTIRKNSEPIIVEALCSRFKGHSISDPGLYRCKEELEYIVTRLDPIRQLTTALTEAGALNDTLYKNMEIKAKNIVMKALQYAEESPWPSITELEENVYAN